MKRSDCVDENVQNKELNGMGIGNESNGKCTLVVQINENISSFVGHLYLQVWNGMQEKCGKFFIGDQYFEL